MASSGSRWDVANGPVKGLKVADVVPRRKRIGFVQASATVGEALTALRTNNYQSLPCVKVGDRGETSIIGIVDVMDLVLFLVSGLQTDGKTPADKLAVHQLLSNSVERAVAIGRAWHLRDNPALDASAHVKSSEPLEKLCNLMWAGWHRVAVTDETGRSLESFLSQLDVVEFMVQNMNFVLSQGTLKKTVQELFPPKGNVVAARASEVTFDVMTRLVQHKVSSCPVVDNNGTLLGTFSCSDLRHVPQDAFEDFMLPLSTFLTRHSMSNRKFAFPSTRSDLHAIASAQHVCRKEETLESVLYKIVALHSHRLWMVDETGKVNGVVALGDLMKVFIFGSL